MKSTARRHLLFSFLMAGVFSAALFWICYIYCLHFSRDLQFEFMRRAGHWLASSVNLIAILSAVLVFMICYVIVLMERYAARLEAEIEERSIVEEQREEIKQALLQSQKLEAVGMLAGGIAHNFNNILYAIQGYVQMARSDIDSKTMTYQNLGKVLDAVERGQELVQGILCFSRRERYQLDSLSLREVLESVLTLLRSTLPATVALSVSLAMDDAWIRGNRTQLQQVFINIIRNAADSLGENGKILVQARAETSLESLKKLRPGLPYRAYFVVTITDNGSGMTEETLRHLFEPFFTTKDVGKGTGLGLATARSIVRDHHGDMLVQSKPNKGSTFIVLLPMREEVEEKN